ncbi:MAG: hypothetical protein D6B26_04710 [Spirochaetaceae bacterium]|nr:MAG: hypothetical protein D6B26_04710 [Spirochaetaceae bacterium]
MSDVLETAFLNVLGDSSFPENRVVINPNDGLDIGLMMSETVAEIFIGTTPATFDEGKDYSLHGTVVQKNECKVGTVELSLKTLERMGKPKRVRLHLMPEYAHPKLLLAGE